MDFYKSQETFEFNGKTYNKVNITSNWNNIAVRQFRTSLYNEYTVPIGAYSYEELFDQIYNIFYKFLVDNNLNTTMSKGSFAFPMTSGSVSNAIGFTEKNIELVAMENGLQKILPFTVPIMYCHDKDYDNYINSAKNQQIWHIFIFDDIFDMVWLNELFLETTETYNISYPNCFFGTSCNNGGSWIETDDHGSVMHENKNVYNHRCYLSNGVFNVYGLVMMLCSTLINSAIVGNIGTLSSDAQRFMPSLEGNILSVYRSGSDNKWSIIYSTGLFSNHISNYQIKYFDPINWTDDGTIRFDIRPNQIISVEENNFKYNTMTRMMYINSNGFINNTSTNNLGLCMYYNIDNSLVKVKSSNNIKTFYAHFASVDITATFNSVDILQDYNIYVRVIVDNNKILDYTDTFKNIQSKNVSLTIPRTYFGKGLHNITILTNADNYNYIVNEWNIY